MKTLIFDAIVKSHSNKGVKYRISLFRDEETLLYHNFVEQLVKGETFQVETSECFSHDRAFKDFYMYICIYSGVQINYYG